MTLTHAKYIADHAGEFSTADLEAAQRRLAPCERNGGVRNSERAADRLANRLNALRNEIGKRLRMTTRTRLERFVSLRNKSGFASNLQFLTDAKDCGIDPAQFGEALTFDLDGARGYQWDVPTQDDAPRGVGVRMIEYGGNLYLDYQPEAVALFERIKAHAVKVESSK